MNDAIRQWLQGTKNYDEGVNLYLVHGKDHQLKKVFREAVSDFKRRKLIEVMKELSIGKAKVEEKIKIEKEIAIDREARAERKWPKERDAMLQALHEKWKPLFAEMMSLTARIYDVALAGKGETAKKVEAGQMAHRILDLDDMCDAIYEQRDHYLKHGKMPEKPKPLELAIDPIKMPVALANAERYVRQYKNKLKKKPDDVKAVEKLKQYEWAVGEYKKLLKIDV